MNHFYLDIETVPNDKEAYLALGEESRKKLLNPIDSHIVAIGLQKNVERPQILYGEDEKGLLEAFWTALANEKAGNNAYRLVGFNVKDFDLPFLVTRSFIRGVKIQPFLLKDVVDIREQLSVFKYGHTRGKLKEYATLIGITILDDIEGSKVAETYWDGKHDLLKEYLAKDLEITQKLHQRMVELRITDIARW
ncbi:MAG: ribonuclease H-like domain-containing protein [Candidatus Diapherotrites archaeon]